jgi:hypothetical protein
MKSMSTFIVFIFDWIGSLFCAKINPVGIDCQMKVDFKKTETR